MNETGIAWTEATWNPASGCEVVSEGCKFCYAKTLAERRRGTLAFPNGFDLTIRRHKLSEPRKLKKPSLIFVNSMSDLFWEAIPDSYRHEIVDVMEQTPQHQYQVLTKRPEVAVRFWKTRPVPSNVWCGVTIESDRTTWRADLLREIDAQIRFISAEPLLSGLPSLDLTGLHWVITGGESGSHLHDARMRARRGMADPDARGKWHARPDRMDWVRDVRDRCGARGVAFFHKQWGGLTSHSAGRELDGRTWDEFPRYPEGGSWRDTHVTEATRAMSPT